MVIRRTRTASVVLAGAALMLAGCAAVPFDATREVSVAVRDPQTIRGRLFEAELAAHPGQSGFRLLPDGSESLAARLVLIDAAQRTVDAQYYLFRNDGAGRLVAERLVAAAERGVRVRLLVDDWPARGQDRRLAQLDLHPLIEVRVFNPLGAPRGWPATRPILYALGPDRVRRRMHNKALVVDSTAAIVGGRNIADEYFSAGAVYNFRDLDLLAAGSVALQAAAAFDEYWNHRLAVPIRALTRRPASGVWRQAPEESTQAPPPAKTGSDPTEETSRGQSPISPAAGCRAPDASALSLKEMLAATLVWAEGEALYDRPAKVLTTPAKNPAAYLVFRLNEMLGAARQEVLLVSPFFLPEEDNLAWLRPVRERGADVRILTNSLESTDQIAVYAAFRERVPDLLREGIQVYALRARPDRTRPCTPVRDDHAADLALHAKYFVVDRRLIFVGSHNFDPRSAWLDTQNGVAVKSEELARELADLFAHGTSSCQAFQVRLRTAEGKADSGRLNWVTENGTGTLRYDREPGTGRWRAFKAKVLCLLAPTLWL